MRFKHVRNASNQERVGVCDKNNNTRLHGMEDNVTRVQPTFYTDICSTAGGGEWR